VAIQNIPNLLNPVNSANPDSDNYPFANDIMFLGNKKHFSIYHSSFHDLKVVAIQNIPNLLNPVNSANPDSDNY
jgi:hypothetical protein